MPINPDDVWFVPSATTGGSGDPENPYQVQNQNQLQAHLNGLNDHAVVHLLPGTYVCDRMLVLKSKMRVLGSGTNATILKFSRTDPALVNEPCIGNPYNTYGQGMEISDLSIDGDGQPPVLHADGEWRDQHGGAAGVVLSGDHNRLTRVHVYNLVSPPSGFWITVKEAGTAAANGRYFQETVGENGKPYYKLEGAPGGHDFTASVFWTGSLWRITDSAGASLYESTENTLFPFAATRGSWTVATGSGPAPKFVAGDYKEMFAAILGPYWDATLGKSVGGLGCEIRDCRAYNTKGHYGGEFTTFAAPDSPRGDSAIRYTSVIHPETPVYLPPGQGDGRIGVGAHIVEGCVVQNGYTGFGEEIYFRYPGIIVRDNQFLDVRFGINCEFFGGANGFQDDIIIEDNVIRLKPLTAGASYGIHINNVVPGNANRVSVQRNQISFIPFSEPGNAAWANLYNLHGIHVEGNRFDPVCFPLIRGCTGYIGDNRSFNGEAVTENFVSYYPQLADPATSQDQKYQLQHQATNYLKTWRTSICKDTVRLNELFVVPINCKGRFTIQSMQDNNDAGVIGGYAIVELNYYNPQYLVQNGVELVMGDYWVGVSGALPALSGTVRIRGNVTGAIGYLQNPVTAGATAFFIDRLTEAAFKTTDTALEYSVFSGGSWGAWTSLGVGVTGSAFTYAGPDGHAFLIWRGGDGRLRMFNPHTVLGNRCRHYIEFELYDGSITTEVPIPARAD